MRLHIVRVGLKLKCTNHILSTFYTLINPNYTGVQCLFVTPSVLQTDRQTDRQTERERERERERENYACVYVCICDAQHSSGQFIEKGFKKAKISKQNVVLLCFFNLR